MGYRSDLWRSNLENLPGWRRWSPGVPQASAWPRPACWPAGAAAWPGRDRQHLLDRGHRGPAAAGAVQRDQGRRLLAHAGHGGRPRGRGHQGELRDPGYSRHPVGGTAAGRRARPGGRTRRAQRAPADRPAGQRGRGRRGHGLPGQPAGRGHHGHGAGRGRRHAGPADPAQADLIHRASGRRGKRRMTRITGFDTFDIRFPTSRTLAGSDAMNPAPDYSAAYVVIRTDAADPALSGHGFAFTIGRGNDVQLAAIRLLEPFLAGQDLDEVLADLGGLGRRLVSDSPLHWLGPSCGVIHMATGAVLNACWDLAARRAAKPLWLLLAEMSPEELTALVDFRYLSDALTPDEALALLERGAAGRDERIAVLRRDG